MKVLHVTEAYGGGVLTILNQLANGLVSKDIDVSLALSVRPEAPPDWNTQLDKRIRVHPLSIGREIHPLRDAKALLELIRLFRRERPDVIHLHSSKAGFLGRIAAWITGDNAATVYSPHAFAYLAPDLSPSKRWLYRFLEKIGAKFGGLLIACSKDEFDEARKLGVPATAINNSIDLPFVDEVASTANRREGSTVRVITAGRICAAKRPWFFVAVAEEAKRLGLPCEFLWIGGGETPPPTAAVTFTGWKPRTEVLRNMRALGDVYVQTSAYEGLPVAILEAQALGLPVVATDAVGNNSAIADGVTGYISSSDSVIDFVEKLRILVEQPELRKSFGVAARKRIEREFDAPLMLTRYVECYKARALPC